MSPYPPSFCRKRRIYTATRFDPSSSGSPHTSDKTSDRRTTRLARSAKHSSSAHSRSVRCRSVPARAARRPERSISSCPQTTLSGRAASKLPARNGRSNRSSTVPGRAARAPGTAACLEFVSTDMASWLRTLEPATPSYAHGISPVTSTKNHPDRCPKERARHRRVRFCALVAEWAGGATDRRTPPRAKPRTRRPPPAAPGRAAQPRRATLARIPDPSGGS